MTIRQVDDSSKMNFKIGCDTDKSPCLFKKFKTKRQQAIAEREQVLLCLAERLMEEHGFSGLTMDKLVAACDYSKGTVYNHFSSKEDLLSALCIKAMQTELQLFHKASNFKGNAREKLLALCFAYRLHALLHPTLFYCVLTSKTPAVAERASQERLDTQFVLEQQLAEVCNQLFVLAMEDGDLQGREEAEFAQLSFAAWAMAFGSTALMLAASTAQLVQALEEEKTLMFNMNLMLDGMQWLPLSSEFDYWDSWQRVGMEVFADELSTLKEHTKHSGAKGRIT